MTTDLYIHLQVLGESAHIGLTALFHCICISLHECSGRFLGEAVNVCVVVKHECSGRFLGDAINVCVVVKHECSGRFLGDAVNVCVVVKHECSGRFLGDAVNVCVVVKLAIESYTKEIHRVRQGDGVSSNTDGTHCLVPVIPIKMIILVFSALMLSPLVSQLFSIVFIVFCVRCQMTTVSLPSASVTRLSANALRYPGISFAENLSR